MDSHSQINYMPYIFMQQEPLSWGLVTIWNFDREYESRFENKFKAKYIRKLLAANVSKGEVIRNVGVITHQNRHLEPITSKERQDIEELRKVLFICSVARNNIYDGENAGGRMVTADNFIVICQNFTMGSLYTAHTTGNIVRISNGGLKVGEVKYDMPSHVLDRPLTIDHEMFRQLQILKIRKPLIFRRVIRAIDSIMSSYYNGFEISQDGRILQQARAFEILFDLPDGKKQRIVFKDKIEDRCSLDTDKKITFKSERGKIKENELGTYARKWADRFYVLRNHIIHGKNIRPAQYSFSGQRHQDLAIWFFLVSLKKEINRGIGVEIFFDILRFEKGKFKYDSRSLYGILVRNSNALRKRKVFGYR